MPDTYTTVQGDAWDLIAFKLWGEEKQMHKLIETNPSHKETAFFNGGIVLTIPDIESPVKSLPLPPWRKRS